MDRGPAAAARVKLSPEPWPMDSDRVKGKLEEGEGKLTGDDQRKADGQMQQTKGKAKDKLRDAKDKVT